jgi:hypothetical protein
MATEISPSNLESVVAAETGIYQNRAVTLGSDVQLNRTISNIMLSLES